MVKFRSLMENFVEKYGYVEFSDRSGKKKELVKLAEQLVKDDSDIPDEEVEFVKSLLEPFTLEKKLRDALLLRYIIILQYLKNKYGEEESKKLLEILINKEKEKFDSYLDVLK